MKYSQTKPCKECPFLRSMKFNKKRLAQFAQNNFPCHKSAELVESDERYGEYQATDKSVQCAGALIYNEKRSQPNQMMRISERLCLYDFKKLDMTADIV